MDPTRQLQRVSRTCDQERCLVRDFREQITVVKEIKLVIRHNAIIDIADLNPPVAIADDYRVTNVDKQPIFHNARDLVQHKRDLLSITDTDQVQIEDIISLI